MSPSSGFSLFTALSRASITRFSLMRGGGHLPSDYLAREQVEVGGQAGPSFPRGYVGDVAAPHAVPLLDGEFPVQDIDPLSEASPPLLCFLGPCRIPALSSPSCAARSCRSRRCRSCEARRRSASTRICDCWRRRCPRRTAPAPRGLSASMIWGGSGRHNIRPC